MSEQRTFLKRHEASFRPCGHWCRAEQCTIFNGKCHCGGCVNEAKTRGLTMALDHGFGYA